MSENDSDARGADRPGAAGPSGGAGQRLLLGFDEVATPDCAGEAAGAPLSGSRLAAVRRIRAGAVLVADQRVVAVGPATELEPLYPDAERVAHDGGVLIPGFVDAHTHPVFFGTRELEFEMRLAGRSYAEIAAAGGGILSSIQGVRGASSEQLLALLLTRMDRFLALGTTTVEAKTGYGLDLESELRGLEVIAEANRRHPVELVPTFLGAHAYPPEFGDRKPGYVDLLEHELLPAVVDQGVAEYADVFTEEGAFSLDDSRRLMRRAQELGLGLRLHVDQLTPLGGAQLAAELGAATADHLENVSPAGIEALASAGVQPVLCPLVPFFIRASEQEAPGRRLAEAGLAPVISTDFNPGSCYTQSMPEVCTWSALRYGYSAAECLVAATHNAACSVGRGERLGAIEPGKQADFVWLDGPNLEHLTYEFGRSPVRAVYKAGECVHRASAGWHRRLEDLER
ncbi:MAG: imidazolonepropionase [Planctomycetota bacterium]|jgi:imidazolonepropionase